MTESKSNIPVKILIILLSLGLLLIPFFYWPKAAVEFEVPKVNLVRVWIEVLVILGLAAIQKFKFDNKSDKYLIYAVAGFLLAVIISSFAGVNTLKSYVGNYYRNDGIFTLLHLIAFFFVLSFLETKKWLEISLKSIALSGLFLSLGSIATFILINIFGRFDIEVWVDGGIGLAFGNPNFLTGYLLLTLPLLVYIFEPYVSNRKRLLLVLSLIAVTGAILLTRARAGVAGILVFYVLWVIMINKNRILKILTAATLIIFTALFLLIFKPGIFANNQTFVAESRQRIMIKGLLAFEKRPLLGYGWANFDRAFEAVDWPIHFVRDVYVDKAHSSLMEVLVTTGITGFVFYCFIILRSIINLWNSKTKTGKYLLISFLLIIIQMQVQIVSVSEELIFWLIVAAASAYSVSHRSEVPA